MFPAPLRLAALLFVAFATPVVAQQSATPNQRTTADFGKPFVRETPANWLRMGNLVCDTPAQTACVIANMPLVSQVDPNLRAPLAAYVARYTNPDGKIVWAEPQFQIPPTPMTPDAFVSGIQDNGCYISSITTIMDAALANMAKNMRPGGRVAQYRAIAADPAHGLATPLAHLLWQYERWADKLQPNRRDPQQPSSPDFLELDEFAAAFPGGAANFSGVDNPAGLTNAQVISGVKSGRMGLIAYVRYAVSVGPPDASGHMQMTLTKTSQHKVAVAGFDNSAYPVLVNDVGDGMHRLIRFSSDWSATKYTMKNPQTGAIEAVPFSRLKVDPKFASRTLIFYEDHDEVRLNDRNRFVIVVENYATLFVPADRATGVADAPADLPQVASAKSLAGAWNNTAPAGTTSLTIEAQGNGGAAAVATVVYGNDGQGHAHRDQITFFNCAFSGSQMTCSFSGVYTDIQKDITRHGTAIFTLTDANSLTVEAKVEGVDSETWRVSQTRTSVESGFRTTFARAS